MGYHAKWDTTLSGITYLLRYQPVMTALYVLHYAVCNVDEYWKKFTLPRTGRHDDYWWASPVSPGADVGRHEPGSPGADVGRGEPSPGAEEERSGTIQRTRAKAPTHTG